ncbi:MAG: DUF1028 domain-containing protein [Proteobacteria bacterium]|nr:DUF1028 domain-containing protein [Pseudomonadota bacterium]
MTWSIIARDPPTGAFGIAVATRFFAVGSLVPHARSEVGALCTQALVNPTYGPAGLKLLTEGVAAAEVVKRLTAADAGAAHRQLHVMDRAGRTAAHTGSACVSWCGGTHAEDYSIAGNMLTGPAVIEATADAFRRHADRPFAERLIAALEAGEAAGGDKRGKQSAVLLICSTEDYPDLDLRVDDHVDPLVELRRLYEVSQTYYTPFKRFLPTRAHPAGIFDRTVIEAGIKATLASR